MARMSVAMEANSTNVGVPRWPSGRVHYVVAHLYDPESFQPSASVQGYLKEGRSESEFRASKVPSSTISLCGAAKDTIGRILAWATRASSSTQVSIGVRESIASG